MYIGRDKVTETRRFSNLTLVVIFVFVFLVIVCAVLGVGLYNSERTKFESRQATQEAQKQLTESYRIEISRVIENFEVKWRSLDAYKNPEVQSEVATEPYLNHAKLIRHDDLYELQYWQITTLAIVQSVHVYEYTPQRFKVGACVERSDSKVTPQGELIETIPPYEICGIYVFIRAESEEAWKLAGYFFTDLPYSSVKRDWYQMPEWLREVMGDLPDELPEPNGK